MPNPPILEHESSSKRTNKNLSAAIIFKQKTNKFTGILFVSLFFFLLFYFMCVFACMCLSKSLVQLLQCYSVCEGFIVRCRKPMVKNSIKNLLILRNINILFSKWNRHVYNSIHKYDNIIFCQQVVFQIVCFPLSYHNWTI